MGDKNELMRRIYRVLYEVNRHHQSPREHFQFLESLRAPLLPILSELRRQIAIEGYPADPKSYRLAVKANRMFSEMIVGYRQVLKADKSEGWVGRALRRAFLVTIYYRLFEYYGAIACNFRLLQTPYPKEMWARIHHLYKKARRYRCTRHPIADPELDIKTNIEQAYKRILLMALLSPGDFRRDLLDSVHILTANWSRHIELKERSHARHAMYTVPLLLQRDAPPKAMTAEERESKRHRGKTLHLNIKTLVKNIDRMLNNNKGEFVQFNDELRIPVDVLRVLKERLLSLNAPRETRVPGDERYTVTVGFLAIHAGIAGDWRDNTRREELARIQAKREQLGSAAHDRPPKPTSTANSQRDIWDMIYVTESPPLPHETVQKNDWVENAQELALAPLDGSEVNFSLGGCCLSLPTPAAQRFRVGELVGLNPAGSMEWRIGVLRWLHYNDDERWYVGVKHLASQCVPVHLVVRSDHGLSKPVNCLIGRDPKQGLLMYVPYLPGLNGKKLGIVRGQHTCPIELGARVSFSPLFEAYKFLAVSALVEPHHTLFESPPVTTGVCVGVGA